MSREYPRVLYREAEAKPVATEAEGDALLADGWTIEPTPRYWHPGFVEPDAEAPILPKKGRK